MTDWVTHRHMPHQHCH